MAEGENWHANKNFDPTAPAGIVNHIDQCWGPTGKCAELRAANFKQPSDPSRKSLIDTALADAGVSLTAEVKNLDQHGFKGEDWNNLATKLFGPPGSATNNLDVSKPADKEKIVKQFLESAANSFVMRASGWHPDIAALKGNADAPLGDGNENDPKSNASSPTVGLTQILPSTFEKYSKAGDSITDPEQNMAAAFRFLKERHGSLTTSPLTGLPSEVPPIEFRKSLIDNALKDAGVDLASEVKNLEQRGFKRDDWNNLATKLFGQPGTASNHLDVSKPADKEQIVKKFLESATDSFILSEGGWIPPDPSQRNNTSPAGVMRLLPSTFAKFSRPGDVITDPEKNIAVAFRYAISHYGSLTTSPLTRQHEQVRPAKDY